jgi:S1-C subfamily serine protease
MPQPRIRAPIRGSRPAGGVEGVAIGDALAALGDGGGSAGDLGGGALAVKLQQQPADRAGGGEREQPDDEQPGAQRRHAGHSVGVPDPPQPAVPGRTAGPAIRPVPQAVIPGEIAVMTQTVTGSAMTDTSAFAALSQAIEAAARHAAPLVAGLDWCGRHHISGILWRSGVLVTSEQSLPEAEAYSAVLPGGARVAATLAGRDPATNVAALRLEGEAPPVGQAEPGGVGALILALGSDGTGGITARMGPVEVLGPAWESMRGGRIDRLMRLGVRLGEAAEGGPVIDASGRLIGMSTFGPRRTVLVIPASTIARVLEPLLRDGQIARGWLGVGLHPVALPHDLAERAGAAQGLMVVSIAEGAPAAGVLLPGDILLEIAGRPVATPRSVAAALGPEQIGAHVALKVLRGGAVAMPSVTIAARPA